jgi:cell wall-associated NlpC family hydrolase
MAQVWSSPRSPRPVDEPILRPEPDLAGWTAGLSVTARLGLHGRVVTQGLFGEPVQVLRERDGWTQVVLTRQPSGLDRSGYPGWVRTAHLTTDGQRPARDGVIPPPGVSLPSSRLSGGALLAVARCFLGVEYLWSGMSGYGVDCSGLMVLVHRWFGLYIPRDTDDQMLGGLRVDPAEAEPGDLLLFRDNERVHHVGMAAGDGIMLHSPRTGHRVELISLTTPPYARHLCAARRYWHTDSAHQSNGWAVCS